MVASIVVVSVLTCMPCFIPCVIWKLHRYVHALWVRTPRKQPKTFVVRKGEGIVDPRRVTRWLKKFHACCRKLNNRAMSGRPKTVDSKALLYVVDVNLVSSTQRVSGELNISQSSVVDDHQTRLGRPKTVDSKALLYVIDVNLVSSTQRVSGELSILQSCLVCHLHDVNWWIVSCYQNITNLMTHPCNIDTHQ